MREPSFALVDNVVMSGGYAGLTASDPDVRDIRRFATILSGDLAGDDVVGNDFGAVFTSRRENSKTVVTATGLGVRTALDGVFVAGGHNFDPDIIKYEGAGGGLVVRDGELTMRNCVFEHSFASGGGGTLITRSDVTIEDCEFQFNGGGGFLFGGGGILAQFSTVTIRSSVLWQNRSSQGGGIEVFQSTLTMEHSRMTGNGGSPRGAWAARSPREAPT